MAKLKKKVVLVIVEGPSDEEALSYNLQKLYSQANKELVVEVVHGDLTIQTTDRVGIAEVVGNEVKKVLREKKWKPSDLHAIFQIVDTDGAFVPDSSIREVAGQTSVIYDEEEIVCQNKTFLIERNRIKSVNLRGLSKKKFFSIKSVRVPFRIVYMSSCLEHVLFDKTNCSDEEKQLLSERFEEMYSEDAEKFCEFFLKSDFVVSGSYNETWDFIEVDNRSLHRHSNLNKIFPSSEEEMWL